ncbi:putative Zinc finger protein [Blattamonas nauphoetae]|uniref:Zinc finger protein n=1 Tax=Blattamonas nauphoetae TaxID=2049346 RepID=A0ABQ9XPE3_9EUKA|nr:putative Zinc finger protein [Blattamonas nauphoetae]
MSLKRFTCSYCDYSTDYLSSLKAHERIHTGEKPFQCTVSGCGKAFTTSYDLKRHKRTHTGEKPFKCPVSGCGKAFATSSGLITHKRTHTGEKPYKCTFTGCGKAFSALSAFNEHRRIHSGEKPYKCAFTGCGKAFSKLTNLKTHERIHTGEKPYKCTFLGCGKAFSKSSNLTVHERTHTGERPFQCPFLGCGKAFSESSQLIRHERIHTGEKPYKCPFSGCGKAFSDLSAFKEHRRIHTGETPYKCTITGCGKAFSQLSNLKRHKRIHTREKPFQCSFRGCGKAFTTSSNLKQHERIHSGEKPFKCSFTGCEKAFIESSKLIRHQRVHTGERPFKCTFLGCRKAFSDLTAFKTHRRIHTGEKPYKCSYSGCEKAFTASNDLKKHERTHTGDKPYKCSYPGCGKTFTALSSLETHGRTLHNIHHPPRQSRGEVSREPEDEVMSICDFCSLAARMDDGLVCVKCGAFCHASCASQDSLFAKSAVRAMDFEKFLCDSCFGELSPPALAELLFPVELSIVLHHTSLFPDGSCAVLGPCLSHPFNLVLARSHHPFLTGFSASVGVFVEGVVNPNELVAVISGRRVPTVSSTAVFTRSDGVHLDTSLSPLPSRLIRRCLECGNCVEEDGLDSDGTRVIFVRALRVIADEELVLWEGRGMATECDSSVAGNQAELGMCECGSEVNTIDLRAMAETVLSRLEENERQLELVAADREARDAEWWMDDNPLHWSTPFPPTPEETAQRERQQATIQQLREVIGSEEDALPSNKSRLVVSSSWLRSECVSAADTEQVEVNKEPRTRSGSEDDDNFDWDDELPFRSPTLEEQERGEDGDCDDFEFFSFFPLP